MSAPTGFNGLASGVSNALGAISLPGAFNAGTQPNPANTTTAVNMAIVSKGNVVGLVRSLSIDEQFNIQRVKAIGSAVDVALLPGIYEATGSFSKAFIFGQSLEQALGGGIRPVIGQYQVSPDFTQFYFNIALLDNNGNSFGTYHDCVLTSVRAAIEIESVVILSEAQILIRWSEGIGAT